MKRSNAILVTVAVSLIFAFFFIYPALSVVKEAFQSEDGLTLDFVREVFRNPVYVEGLRNALMLGIVSTLATFVIAFPLALISHRLPSNSICSLWFCSVVCRPLPIIRTLRGEHSLNKASISTI